MKYRWISWYAVPDTLTGNGKFELNYPWWVSGMRCSDGADTICAAIPVASAGVAEKIVLGSYDERPGDVEWRFNTPRDTDVEPVFNERFPRAGWMKWPFEAEALARKGG